MCEGYGEEKQGREGSTKDEKAKLRMADVIRESQKVQLCTFASLLKVQTFKFAPVGADAKFTCVGGRENTSTLTPALLHRPSFRVPMVFTFWVVAVDAELFQCGRAEQRHVFIAVDKAV